MKENVLFAVQQASADIDGAQEQSDALKFLIFMTDGLRIGVEAGYVVEILTTPVITDLPRVPAFIRGIINLRGQIVPILDVRLRLGKAEKEDCIVVVLNVNGTAVGILVDSVDQMIDIPRESILPMPIQSDQQLVSGMCSLPGQSGTMMLLDCDQLLTHG